MSRLADRRLATALTGIAALAVAALAQAPLLAQPPDSVPAPAGAEDKAPVEVMDSDAKAGKFDHQQHADLDKPAVTEDNCADCHASDARGKLAAPGRQGHKPCLDSGCHVDHFLGVGETTRLSKNPADQKRYKAAVRFCRGCHSSAAGRAPPSFRRAEADRVFRDNPLPNFHVEMDHLAHTKKAKCRDCHVVDTESHSLKVNAPGHDECSRCHGDPTNADAQSMGECAACHSRPGPQEYFTAQREDTEVRSCGSRTHVQLARARRRKLTEVPCFLHDSSSHRYRDEKSKTPLQCGHCHFMFADPKKWRRGESYRTIRDIKKAPVMNNKRDRAHRRCGDSRACHAGDVNDRLGTSRCTLCHSQKTIDDGLFGGREQRLAASAIASQRRVATRGPRRPVTTVGDAIGENILFLDDPVEAAGGWRVVAVEVGDAAMSSLQDDANLAASAGSLYQLGVTWTVAQIMPQGDLLQRERRVVDRLEAGILGHGYRHGEPLVEPRWYRRHGRWEGRCGAAYCVQHIDGIPRRTICASWSAFGTVMAAVIYAEDDITMPGQ